MKLCELETTPSLAGYTRSGVPVPETQQKPYFLLAPGDRFDGFYGKRWQRVRVIGEPVINAGFIDVSLCPAQMKKPSQIERRRFRGSNLITVYPRQTPAFEEQRHKTVVLQQLQPGKASRSTSILTKEHPDLLLIHDWLKQACRSLAADGSLIAKQRGGVTLYRSPVAIGMPVVEYPGTRSERYGCVEEFKLHLKTQQLEPIVRWVDGSFSFSREAFLEPVETDWKRKWIGIAQRQYQGDRLRGANLPQQLFNGLLKADREAFRELFHLLNLPPQHGRMQRNWTVFWLENYFPTWEEETAPK